MTVRVWVAMVGLLASCSSSASSGPPTGPVQGDITNNGHFMSTFANAPPLTPGFVTLRFTNFEGSCMNGINWPAGPSGVELDVIIPQAKVQVASYSLSAASPLGGSDPTADVLFGAFQQMTDVRLSGTLTIEQASSTQISGWLRLSDANGRVHIEGNYTLSVCP